MKKLFAILICLLFLSACAEESKPVPSENSVVFEDALGYRISVAQPQKVAALGGSNAETWLLAGGSLAALTEDAYAERGIEPSEETVNLGSVKTPDIEKMILTGIDFVILNPKITEHVALRDTLENAGMTTAYFEVETFRDYLSMLKLCTEITGHPELYEKNGTSVQAQIDAAISRKEGRPSPSVLFIRAYSTNARAKGSDTMTGTMLKDLGCRNIADTDGSLLDNLSMEVIIREDPDFIFVTSQGASTEAAEKTLAESIQSNPAWKDLSAVKNGRFIWLPKNLFHYKPNHRWGESYEILANILYGEKEA